VDWRRFSLGMAQIAGTICTLMLLHEFGMEMPTIVSAIFTGVCTLLSLILYPRKKR
jgi:hypothetical protein